MFQRLLNQLKGWFGRQKLKGTETVEYNVTEDYYRLPDQEPHGGTFWLSTKFFYGPPSAFLTSSVAAQARGYRLLLPLGSLGFELGRREEVPYCDDRVRDYLHEMNRRLAQR